MKKEFKTLKDLYKEGELSIDPKTSFVNQIKAEAIKWVKEYQLSPFGTFCEFFNITKEDLK